MHLARITEQTFGVYNRSARTFILARPLRHLSLQGSTGFRMYEGSGD